MFRYAPCISVLRLLKWRGSRYFKEFSASNEMMVWFFFFQFVSMVDYVEGFSYIKSSLNPWDEAYLLMVDDVFDMVLNLICEYFLEYLWINVHKNGPERNYVGWFCVRGWLRESLCTVYMVSTAIVRNSVNSLLTFCHVSPLCVIRKNIMGKAF